MVDRITYDLRIRLYEKKDIDLITVYMYCNNHNISFSDLCRSLLHRYLDGNATPIRVPGMSPLTQRKQSYIINIGLYEKADEKVIEFIRTLSKNSINAVIKQVLKYYFGLQMLVVFQRDFRTFSEDELMLMLENSQFEFIEVHQKNYKIKRSEDRVPKRTALESTPDIMPLDSMNTRPASKSDNSSQVSKPAAFTINDDEEEEVTLEEIPNNNISDPSDTSNTSETKPTFALNFEDDDNDEDVTMEEYVEEENDDEGESETADDGIDFLNGVANVLNNPS